MPFSSGLKESKMVTASSRIWTQIPESISYNDNHYTKHLIYLPNPSTTNWMWRKFNFSSWFEFSNPSPRLVIWPRIKNQVCLTIYQLLWREQMDSYLSHAYKSEVKCQQSCPRFEPRSSVLMLITITLYVPWPLKKLWNWLDQSREKCSLPCVLYDQPNFMRKIKIIKILFMRLLNRHL